MLYKKLFYYETIESIPLKAVAFHGNTDSIETRRVKKYVSEDEARILFHKGIIQEELVPAFTQDEAEGRIKRLNDEIRMLEQHIQDLKGS